MPTHRNVSSVTIASGASLSDALPLLYLTLVGLVLPALWTTASVSFAVSLDGTTYVPLYDESGELVITTADASRAIRLDPAKFVGWLYVKVRSGTAGAPVNQAGARVISTVSAEIG